jgi:hypothetical protein
VRKTATPLSSTSGVIPSWQSFLLTKCSFGSLVRTPCNIPTLVRNVDTQYKFPVHSVHGH